MILKGSDDRVWGCICFVQMNENLNNEFKLVVMYICTWN